MSAPLFTPTHHQKSYPAIDPSNPALSAKGKVIVVIGGGRGIGKHIALSFARAGAQSIALVGRDSANLQNTASEVSVIAPQTKTGAYSVDVTDPRATLTAFQTIKSRYGSIDVVVSAAGYLPSVKVGIKDSDFDDWWLGYEINVKGTFTVIQAFLQTAPRGATFIALSSAAAHVPYLKGYSSYSSSKLAVAKLLEDVHGEHPEYRIFNYHPGVVETDMNIKSGFPAQDDMSLPATYAVWLASSAADPFRGRYLWAHWDVTELLEKAAEIESKGHLVTGLRGWPVAA